MKAPVHAAQFYCIETIYRRVTPEEFARLQSDAKAAESFFWPNLEELVHTLEELDNPQKMLAQTQEQEGGDRYLFIGTDWHALHFLLTGDGELKPHPLPPPPLGNVVLGGTETQWPCKLGHVRSLTPDEVRAVADALVGISVEQLRSRFSVASFNAAQIYPYGKGARVFNAAQVYICGKGARWTDEAAETVFEIYPQVVEFFQLAARDGDMILLSLD